MSKIARKKPIILTLETSGRTGSAALAAAEELIADKTFSTPVRHSSEIFPAITGLLQAAGLEPSDVEHIYITTGPGSFTGLRIAAAFAKIMHLANNNIKIVAVDTLDCIAANIIDFQKQTKADIKKVAAILDAKRGEFFTAVYERTQVSSDSDSGFATPMAGWTKTVDDCLLTPAQFIEKFADAAEPVWLLGEGLVFYRKTFEAKGIEFVDEKFWQPSASQVHKLGYNLALMGQFADPLSLVPKYLQRPDIRY
jgi:tRNA threonylcarbamoyl adenosine modification protein YeaZ